MFVYSKKIVQFINALNSQVKDVLRREMGLKVFGERFYNRQNSASYPIKVVIYNHKNMLGYFDAEFYELGFHECLLHSSQKQLLDLVRHELAHYLTYIEHGSVQAHGAEFRAFCQRMGWGEEVYLATTCLDSSENVLELPASAVLRKVQKLMALASSSNQHEAEQAMIKSQQLLLKHNLESKYIEAEEGKIFLKRIMKQKKETAKMRAIAKILETFFVNIIYHRSKEGIYLEILGDAVNIEIAEYVAQVLDGELENLWNQAKKLANLKGAIAKNSFFLGIAKGYCTKIQALKREYSSEISNALIVIEKQLVDAKELVYKRLSATRSNASHCHTSSALGELMGRQLNIKRAVNSSTVSNKLLIANF